MARHRTALNLSLITAHLVKYRVPGRGILTIFDTYQWNMEADDSFIVG